MQTELNHSKNEQINLTLVKFLMLCKKQVIKLGNAYGLTAMQTMVVLTLDRPCPMHKLKESFDCDASNITGIIDGLEQKGLLKRYESTEDRRIKMIKLLNKGLEVRKQLFQNLSLSNNPLLKKLSIPDKQSFMDLLGKITAEEEVV